MSHKKQRRFRRASRRPPASGRKPTAKLPAHTVAASAEALLALHARFAGCFGRREQRDWSLFYLCGQLSNLPRKTIEAMVLNLHSANGNAGRDLERFLSQGRWDQYRMIQQQRVIAAEGLGEPDGVVIVDGSGLPKQGDHSVGVAYQYCGHVGKVANCQQGVFLVYASDRGHAFWRRSCICRKTGSRKPIKRAGKRVAFQPRSRSAPNRRSRWTCSRKWCSGRWCPSGG